MTSVRRVHVTLVTGSLYTLQFLIRSTFVLARGWEQSLPLVLWCCWFGNRQWWKQDHNSVVSKTKSIRPRLRPRPRLAWDQSCIRPRSQTPRLVTGMAKGIRSVKTSASRLLDAPSSKPLYTPAPQIQFLIFGALWIHLLTYLNKNNASCIACRQPPSLPHALQNQKQST